MVDSLPGFRMTRITAPGFSPVYDVLYNNNSCGRIYQNVHVEGEWLFTADWNGRDWSANSASDAKKIARRELKAIFKSKI